MNNQATTHMEILATLTRKERTTWTRIGTAFPTKDGKGYRLKLDFIPVGAAADVLLLPPRPAQESTEGQ